MAILNSATKVTLPGNGTATVFSFSPLVVVLATTELVVIRVDAAGVETTLVEEATATGYSISLDEALPISGGSITYPAVGGTPLPIGESLVVRRVMTMDQQTVLNNVSGYFPKTLEHALDKLTAIAIQQQEELDRAIVLPVGASTSLNRDLDPAGTATFLARDVSGNIIEALGTSANLGPVTPFIDTLLDDADAAAARATLGATTTYINVLDNGLVGDGVTDDSAALATLLTATVAAGVRRTIFFPAGTYVFNSGWTVDIGFVSILADKATFDFSNMTIGVAITVESSLAPVASFKQWVGSIGGFNMLGPGDVSTVDGINVASAGGTEAARIKFHDIRVGDFRTGLLLGDNCFLNNFYHFSVEGCAIGLDFPSSSNAGENINSYGGLFASNDLDVRLNNANTQLNYFSPSFDTTKNRVIEVGDVFNARVNVIGGNIERVGGLWAQSVLKATGRGIINCRDVSITQTSTSDGNDPYFEHDDSSNSLGGIFLVRPTLNNLNNASGDLGSGHVEISHFKELGTTVEHERIVSPDTSVLLDGGFELADFEDDWSVDGATSDYKTNANLTIAVSSANPNTGSQHLRASPTADTQRFSLLVPVRPDDTVWFRLFYEWSAAPTSAFVLANWVRAKADPGVADGRAWLVTHRDQIQIESITGTTYAQRRTNNVGGIHHAPAWATHWELRFNMDTATSGKTLDIDDVIVNILRG